MAKVTMKAFLSIKFHLDQRNRGRIEGISSALEQSGLKTYCIVRDLEQWGAVTFKPGQLMQKTFKAIDGCDVVIIDLTEKGVGLGIEAGYAHAKGIPIITVAQKGSDISTTLQGISQQVILYDHFDELTQVRIPHE
jgi:nucleoside 2-deoxyribosyltransferase